MPWRIPSPKQSSEFKTFLTCKNKINSTLKHKNTPDIDIGFAHGTITYPVTGEPRAIKMIGSNTVSASKKDHSCTGTKENLCKFEADDGESDMVHIMATKTMDDLLTEVLRLENFNLKQSSSSGDTHMRVDHSMMSRPQVLVKKEKRFSELDLDPRLRNWNRVLKQRQKIQERIERQTGKRAEDVLFNRSTTIDDASKKMILRILDTADRSRPLDQLKEKSIMRSLKARDDPENCREIKELFLAEPKIQEVEFVGLPQVTQKEVAAIQLAPHAPESQWQRSEVLAKHLEKKKNSIQQVLEFAPDIHQLQVIPAYIVPSSDTPMITKLEDAPILPLSCDSTVEEEEMELGHELDLVSFEGEEIDSLEPQSAPSTREKSVCNVQAQDLDPFQGVNGVMINGVVFDYENSAKPAGKGIQLELQCNPHQRVVKTLLDIQVTSYRLLLHVPSRKLMTLLLTESEPEAD